MMENKIKICRALFCALYFVMLCALSVGCGFDYNEAVSSVNENGNVVDGSTPTDESLIVVGVSQVGSESVWRTANSNSIQNTFTSDNGYFLIFDNARQKQENQIKAIRSFISQQVDYILLSPITEDGWDTVLQEAKDAEIPVILFDRKLNVSDESLYTTWVGSDFYKEGRSAGQWLEQHQINQGTINEALNIVVLQGTIGSTAEVGRTNGFHEIANNHDSWTILSEQNAEYTTTKGKEVMKQMLIDYPELNVVVCQNDDMMFGALEAIEEAGKTTGEDGDIMVISFDACRTALVYISEGKVALDVECNPLQGEYLMEIVRKLEKGEEIEKETYIEEAIFDYSNAKEAIGNRTY